MKVTYYGHSCFSVEANGKVLLFDPFIRGNGLASEIDIDSIHADYILVSHAHEDHTADLVYLANRTNAIVIGIWEVHTWLVNKGIGKTHPMNIGGKREFDFGKVTMTYACHSSSFGDGTYGGQAAGFIIESGGKTIYYSGDTSLIRDMEFLGNRYRIDLALLPIGGNFTMDSIEASEAAVMLKTKHVIGLHYDTFGYIVVNHEEAKYAFNQSGIELTLLNIGESKAI